MTQVSDIVRFRGDKLFQGAVSVDWIEADPPKAKLAATSYLFHGPAYHGVSQADVGTGHGHRLIDSASLTKAVIRRCRGLDDQPFTLAIAGYGTGKSHLALTLAVLLSRPGTPEAHAILNSVSAADPAIGSDLSALLAQERRPYLVVALNGMKNFDLAAEVTRQILYQVRAQALDTRAIEELRPRFRQATILIQMSSEKVLAGLLSACGQTDAQNIVTLLEAQDENTYQIVHDHFSQLGMPIQALGGESIGDVINVAASDYCGPAKPFAGILILFDEFGRYTEFATVRSQIAGSGVLQDLFESVQTNSERVTFFGFIQFELTAYTQRVAPEYKNDILRYVSRYQTASKSYLSVNTETLIAHLLEKQDVTWLDSHFTGSESLRQSHSLCTQINQWFPVSKNYNCWNNVEQFHNVVRRGAWPLSPSATWVLFHFAASGKQLQQRSALALLGRVMDDAATLKIPERGLWTLSAVDLWSDELEEELIASEESQQQGATANSYVTVMGKHGTALDGPCIRTLRAIVLSAKLGAHADSRDDMIAVLAVLSAASTADTHRTLTLLQDEYNIVEWDPNFRQFEILGDAVPKPQFLAFLRSRVGKTFPDSERAMLFASRVNRYSNLFDGVECGFAELSQVTTREWRYAAVTCSVELLDTQIRLAGNQCVSSIATDEPRGTAIFCYVEKNRNVDEVATHARAVLCAEAKERKLADLPVFLVLLWDQDGALGHSLAELSFLEEAMTPQEQVKFGNLVPAQIAKAREVLRNAAEQLILERRYVTSILCPPTSSRLSAFACELFSRIYTSVVPFPFDGFNVAKGNAADTCHTLTSELLSGTLDHDAVLAKPIKVKNRALTVLRDAWGAFSKTGRVSTRLTNPSAQALVDTWSTALLSEGRLCIAEAIRDACKPPFGANVASAGLLFGVFVAARIQKLAVVKKGQRYAVTQWLQNGVFRGKFLDVGSLATDELVQIGEESSEWDSLLDEWDLVESHSGRVRCLERARKLRERAPVPPLSVYRFDHLEALAHTGLRELAQAQRIQEDALDKVASGRERQDASLLTWGGAILVGLRERMLLERPLWDECEISPLSVPIEQVRQALIACFSGWLEKQVPRGENPDQVGDFKHKMIRLIGKNLKVLGLDDLFNALEARVNRLLQQIELQAEARQLCRSAGAWVDQNASELRLVRVAKVRTLLEAAATWQTKLQDMGKCIEYKDISAVRVRISDFMTALQQAANVSMERMSDLLQMSLSTIEDMKTITAEVDDLSRVFEGCGRDLDDLRSMRKGLEFLDRGYADLGNWRLDGQEFDRLAASLAEEAGRFFDEAELPWSVEDTLTLLVRTQRLARCQASHEWVSKLETDAGNVESFDAREATKLRNRCCDTPPILTDEDSIHVEAIRCRVEARLEALKIDWLIEEFKKLPVDTRRKYLVLATALVDAT